MIRIGLLGYGRAGQAVARVLQSDPRVSLQWIARRSLPHATYADVAGTPVRMMGLEEVNLDHWLEKHPVDALVDFSSSEAITSYASTAKHHGLTVLSAISEYQPRHHNVLKYLATDCRVMASPNITLGINYLMLSAKWLSKIAPFADVAVVEQHFKQKPEVSGTARIIAKQVGVDSEHITSLRLGGIVGHHEVIFGFPYQTVRMIHESIGKEAFGTGALFALEKLHNKPPGLYTYENLLLEEIKQAIQSEQLQAA